MICWPSSLLSPSIFSLALRRCCASWAATGPRWRGWLNSRAVQSSAPNWRRPWRNCRRTWASVWKPENGRGLQMWVCVSVCVCVILGLSVKLNSSFYFQQDSSINRARTTKAWEAELLCHYTMQRLYSFSIFTARVFAMGDPANHGSSESATLCSTTGWLCSCNCTQRKKPTNLCLITLIKASDTAFVGRSRRNCVSAPVSAANALYFQWNSSLVFIHSIYCNYLFLFIGINWWFCI